MIIQAWKFSSGIAKDFFSNNVSNSLLLIIWDVNYLNALSKTSTHCTMQPHILQNRVGEKLFLRWFFWTVSSSLLSYVMWSHWRGHWQKFDIHVHKCAMHVMACYKIYALKLIVSANFSLTSSGAVSWWLTFVQLYVLCCHQHPIVRVFLARHRTPCSLHVHLFFNHAGNPFDLVLK